VSSSSFESKQRVYELDIFRFIAMLMVLFYHYAARRHNFNLTNELYNFGLFTEIIRYGYLGVNLFFIISGFVILTSATDKSTKDFFTARVIRLYPTFWICCLLSTLVLLTFGYPVDTTSQSHVINIERVLINLTLLPGYLGQDVIDIVYWSLHVEIKFYFLIAFLIVCQQVKNIERWLWIWILITGALFYFPEGNILFKILKTVSIFPYSPYFIAGMMFYLIRHHGFNTSRIIAIIICSYLAMLQVDHQTRIYLHNASDLEIITTQIIVFSFFLVFLLLSAGWLQVKKNVFIFYLGALTYPMYLLHNLIGKIAYDRLIVYVNKYIVLGLIFIIMIGLSLIIVLVVEKWLGRSLKILLTRLLNKIGNIVKQ